MTIGVDNEDWEILFGDLATGQMSRIRDAIVSVNVSYSSTLCTQLSIELIDIGFEMLANNYFIVGRDIIYRSKTFPVIKGATTPLADNKDRLMHLFEIASVEVRQGRGSSPSIVIQARTKAVQQMKRDKTPGNIKGSSSDYVYNAAIKYGLKPIIEKTTKKRQITKASGTQQADSTWDVLSRLASDSKFMLFETDGMLFFCSMDYLMGRWGVTQIQHSVFKDSKNRPLPSPINVFLLIYPPFTQDDRSRIFTNKFDKVTAVVDGLMEGQQNEAALIPMVMPTVRRSDNDPFLVSGSASIDRTSGVIMRPGMTLCLGGIPTFSDIYMISDVSFDHFSSNPVSIEFSKPEREAKYIQNYEVGPTFADYSGLTERSTLISKTRIV